MYLDTHVVAWLYDALEKKFSVKLKKHMNREELVVSAVVRLELQYLHEIGREIHTPAEILTSVNRTMGVKEAKVVMSGVVDMAMGLTWTRDPFDRMIVAEAILQDAPLVTADVHIRKHYKQSVW